MAAIACCLSLAISNSSLMASNFCSLHVQTFQSKQQRTLENKHRILIQKSILCLPFYIKKEQTFPQRCTYEFNFSLLVLIGWPPSCSKHIVASILKFSTHSDYHPSLIYVGVKSDCNRAMHKIANVRIQVSRVARGQPGGPWVPVDRGRQRGAKKYKK